ncbi:MAG: molybdopterin dinucleotide binding domain-containing protein [Pseudomonadota bacterium]
MARPFGLDLDLTGLDGLDRAGYDALEPVQWPVGGAARFFGDGRFFTEDRRGRMVPTPVKGRADAGLTLNTGRVRDHWHTMTRTAKTPRLSQHLAEPFVEVHPQDAAALGLLEAGLARVRSAGGAMIGRVRVTDRVQPGQVFVPMHWTGEFAAAGLVNRAVPALTDPISGQPELKRACVEVEAAEMAWFAFAISRAEPEPATAYWAKARIADGWRVELAGERPMDDWGAFAAGLLGADEAEAVSFVDEARGTARLAFLREGRVLGALYAASGPVAAARSWLSGLLEAEDLPAPALLAGRPGADAPDPGPTLCACFNVGALTIRRAVLEGGLMSVEAVGAALQAGTNCGSCKPEIAALLDEAVRPLAAE